MTATVRASDIAASVLFAIPFLWAVGAVMYDLIKSKREREDDAEE